MHFSCIYLSTLSLAYAHMDKGGRFGAARKEVKPTRAAVHSARHSKLPPPCNKASTGKGENDDKDCGALALVASQTEQRAAY